jgi:hypothetical protein
VRVAVQDTAALNAISPVEVAAYLRAAGWRQAFVDGDKSSLWLFHDSRNSEAEILLPLRKDFKDYSIRISELLSTLSQVEKRSQPEIFRDITEVTTDLVRVRASNDQVADGTIPLNDAVTLVERSRELVNAAVCAVIEKRPFFATKRTTKAIDYLKRVRMGQTEQGSYVLTILTPVAPALKPIQEELSLEDDQEPFERRVTRTLMEALEALESAARDSALNGEFQPFLDAVKLGVSANLCDAVVGMSSVADGTSIDVEVCWSRTRPAPEKIANRVQLSCDTMPIIGEAARKLKAQQPLEDFEVVGVISGLQSDEVKVEGDIRIAAPVNGKMKKVSVKLDGEHYHEAIAAHREEKLVRCFGELVREGRIYRLKNARDFRVLNEFD